MSVPLVQWQCSGQQARSLRWDRRPPEVRSSNGRQIWKVPTSSGFPWWSYQGKACQRWDDSPKLEFLPRFLERSFSCLGAAPILEPLTLLALPSPDPASTTDLMARPISAPSLIDPSSVKSLWYFKSQMILSSLTAAALPPQWPLPLVWRVRRGFQEREGSWKLLTSWQL